jgi:hypothetical protein
MIDSAWHLLDVTWASGHSTFSSDDFVKRFNDHYFLTAPNDFISDHYPEDLRWTLMNESPTPREFNSSPLKYQAYQKFKITSYYPQKGVIEASPGDTLAFSIEASDALKPLQVFDSVFINPHSDSLAVIVAPVYLSNRKPLTANYVVSSNTPQWIYVVYNDEVILRYRLRIVKREVQ